MYIKIINNELNSWSNHSFDGAFKIDNDYHQIFKNGYQIKNGSVVHFEAAPTYAEKRATEYPALTNQLDMIYWDKVNGTNLWQEKIAEIKAKYPK